jgi:hypothetical protein
MISSFLIYKILSLEISDALDTLAQTLLMNWLFSSGSLTEQKGLKYAHYCPRGNLYYAWKTAVFGLIDQDKFKLPFIKEPTKPLNL